MISAILRGLWAVFALFNRTFLFSFLLPNKRPEPGLTPEPPPTKQQKYAGFDATDPILIEKEERAK